MGQPLVHNVVIVVTPPDDSPVVGISLTVAEPGALRLREGIAHAQQSAFPSEIVRYIADALRQCDMVSVNQPTEPVDGPAPRRFLDDDEAVKAYRDQLLGDIADGKIHVVRNETGEPVIEEGSDPRVTPVDVDAQTGAGDDQGNMGVEDGAGQGMPGADPSFNPNELARDPALDGSASGEKHLDTDKP